MQSHWIEPAPLGNAQRAGMIQVAQGPQRVPLQVPPQPRPQGRHSVLGNLGAISIGALAAAAVGFYFGSRWQKNKVKEALSLNPPEIDLDEFEDEFDDED